MSEPVRLSEDEKWGRAIADTTHGLIRPRELCAFGPVKFYCPRYANWKVGRTKVCGQHAKALANEVSAHVGRPWADCANKKTGGRASRRRTR